METFFFIFEAAVLNTSEWVSLFDRMRLKCHTAPVWQMCSLVSVISKSTGWDCITSAAQPFLHETMRVSLQENQTEPSFVYSP